MSRMCTRFASGPSRLRSVSVTLAERAYDRARVAANSESTAAGSSSSATTRMNHRSTTSSAWPSRVARYRTGPRSASMARRSPSTAAFSIFRSARAFASTVNLSARPLHLVCRLSWSPARYLAAAASAAACT
jgi:hypothetical protein